MTTEDTAQAENKIIRNGKVAVAISPGFGSGWTTWNDEISPFEPKIISMIEEGRKSEITQEWCKQHLGISDVYCSGVDDIKVVWVPIGISFSINEYDGSESLHQSDELKFTA